MKKLITIIALITVAISGFAQTLKVRSDAAFTQLDQRLAAGLNFSIPSGASPSLNGGLSRIGSLFFNTVDNTVYGYNGTSWLNVGGTPSSDWKLTGNTGTVDGTNFIGTTDNKPFNIRVNNQKAGRIDHIDGNTFYGYQSGNANTIGSYNTANGVNALGSNTTGYENTAIGFNALYNNITGDNNIGLGNNADVSTGDLSNSMVFGHNAVVTASNSIQLGNAGVTQVFAGTGTNATLIAGGLKITGGTLSAGKVLTSDAGGVATWETPASWSLSGNTGTVDGTNFIGTTDNKPFNIRVNNQKAGRIDPTLLNSFYGYQSGNSNTTGLNNTATGTASLSSNTEGYSNSAEGYQALYVNTTGNQNTAMGAAALSSNTDGLRNTATGVSALNYSNGNDNTAIGYGTLVSNTTGNSNTGIGFNADVTSGALTNATAIGANSIVTASNAIQLGDPDITQVFAGTGTNATLIAGGLKITGGTLDIGKVLTSDVDGVATWETPIAPSHVYVSDNSNTTYTGAIPIDNSIPQNSEGSSLINATPIILHSTASKVSITVHIQGACSGTVPYLVLAVFRNSDNNSSFTYMKRLPNVESGDGDLTFVDSPATAGSVSYSVRIGISTGNYTTNGYFGGTQKTTFELEEIL